MRSILFVPGNRPDRYQKALATSSDRVCIDLEDGVAVPDKAYARTEALRFIGAANVDLSRIILRINDTESDLGREDLSAIACAAGSLETISLPKVQTPRTVDEALKICPNVRNVIALVETTRGLSNVLAIAEHSRVTAIAFGSADYSFEVGCAMSWDALLYARSRVVQAAVQGGAVPLDGAWLDLNDMAGLQEDSRRLSELGFCGRIALHPNQVDTILQAFSPDAESLAQANRIVAAVEAGQHGAFTLDGRIVDEPIIRRARRILAMAHHPASIQD